ncbi:MAG: arylamine N-acetyltransferase [Reichenbachiella sp.]|uniref:arylamine N-acetyltransferase family protein n=1 Tax=Reichenbachiella sp. TaxID=2184521 RepID=UPI0032651321
MAALNVLDNQSKLPALDVDKYLMRLKVRRERIPNLKFLKTLHKAHLYRIPFENLDIHMGNQIILDVQKIYQKVVLKGRGGFCYELNGLFYHLLSHLGYSCHLISGRTYEDGSLAPEFDHAAILVDVDDTSYLVDVGFGDLFIDPKALHPGKVQMDYTKYFRIDKTIDDEYIVKVSTDSFNYESKYLFTKTKRQLVEFIDMCDYHQVNPKSPFTKKMLITRATPRGRITLTNRKLSATISGKKEEIVLLNHDEFRVKLLQHFGIRFIRNR